MAATARARALMAEGRDVISLALGEPEFASPPHAIEAAHSAALRGDTKYSAVGGTPALKAAIRQKFLRDSGLDFGTDQVLVGHGARQIIFDALIATLEDGDEVIVPAPYWNAYPLIARMAGARPVFVECRESEDFLPTPEDIRASLTPRSKWLVLNFPNNPTGSVCPANHLCAIADVVRAAPQLWVMADDMYEHLIHDGSSNATLAAIAPDLRDRVLTISGVSKTYSMTGWRVGYAGGPRKLIECMAKVQGQSTGGVSPVAQAAALAALEGPQDSVAAMRTAYANRTTHAAAKLAAIPGVTCHRPRGGFYLYPGIAGLLGRKTQVGIRIETDLEFCDALLEEAGVAVVHGAAFGKSPYFRLSTAASYEALEAAYIRIAAFCDRLLEK